MRIRLWSLGLLAPLVSPIAAFGADLPALGERGLQLRFRGRRSAGLTQARRSLFTRLASV